MKYVKDGVLIVLLVLVLFYGKDVLYTTKDALMIWFEKLVPSMFVTLLIIRIIYHRQIFQHLSSSLIEKLFHMDTIGVSLVLCMIFLGFPNGALYVKEAMLENGLSKKGAKRLLYTCSFAAPGFVIMTCGALLFQSMQVGLQLFLAQVISGLLLLLFTRHIPIETSFASNKPAKPLSQSIRFAIIESGKALYLIGGYLMLFMSVASVLFHFLPNGYALPLRILAEFSSGVVLLHKLPYSFITLQKLTCALLSFGGFCVHMQVFSIAEEVGCSYPKYLSFRILQSLLSLFVFTLLI